MTAQGAKLRSASGANGWRALMHWCPACEEVHQFKIAGESPTVWAFDGNFDAPTFSPSMRVSSNHDGVDRFPNGETRTTCHYILTAGRIAFCTDSPHALAGQTVDLPDWPYAPGTYGGIEE